MKSYLVKTPKFVQRIFPERIWAFSTTNKEVYLTFDDGPIPEVTPWVLDLLKKYNAKATFFCIGENIKKHPEVFRQLISEGHSFGNHTFNHLNGWKTETAEYVKNCGEFEDILNIIDLNSSNNNEILKQSRLLSGQDDKVTNHKPQTTNPQNTNLSTKLFRPPYGKITSKQATILQQKGYKIIMWNVLSADFDVTISKEKCFENVISNLQNGSIIVFHDSLKASEKLKFVLPKVLAYLEENNYSCKAIQ